MLSACSADGAEGWKNHRRIGWGQANLPLRLGEDFSIVTEYTSFLVLENDAEYQRWKIARRNLDTSNRDRLAQNERREMLDSIRDRALANLGPQSPSKSSTATPQPSTVAQRGSASPARPSVPADAPSSGRSNARSWDFGGGSGPVGPIGLLACWWWNRRRRKIAA